MLYSFIACLALFALFVVLFLICSKFCLCDCVDNMPFDEGQPLQFEEETQQFVEEGK
jgi:hypothetical protein